MALQWQCTVLRACGAGGSLYTISTTLLYHSPGSESDWVFSLLICLYPHHHIWLTLLLSISKYSAQLTKCANVVLRSVSPASWARILILLNHPISASPALYSGYFAESQWKMVYSIKTEPPLILVTRWSGWLIDWIWDEMWAELSELGCCDATLHHNLMSSPSLPLFSSGHELGEQSRVFISNKIIRHVGFIKKLGDGQLLLLLSSLRPSPSSKVPYANP